MIITISIIIIILLVISYLVYQKFLKKENFPWTNKCRQSYTKEMCVSRSAPIIIERKF